MVAEHNLGPRVHWGERDADGSALVSAPSALKHSHHGGLAVEPPIVDGALECDEELFAR
jgi:hypothetical protein